MTDNKILPVEREPIISMEIQKSLQAAGYAVTEKINNADQLLQQYI